MVLPNSRAILIVEDFEKRRVGLGANFQVPGSPAATWAATVLEHQFGALHVGLDTCDSLPARAYHLLYWSPRLAET